MGDGIRVKGGLRMRLCVRVVRGLALAGLVLGGVVCRPGWRPSSRRRRTAPSRRPASRSWSRATAASKAIRCARISARSRRTLDALKVDEGLQGAVTRPACSPTCVSAVHGGRLVVTVVENPVHQPVRFEGNKKVKDDQLKQEIQSKPRGTLSRPRSSPTCSASSKFTGAAAASTFTSRRRSSSCRTIASTWFSRSTRATRRRQGHRFRRQPRVLAGRLKDVIKTGETNMLSFLRTTTSTTRTASRRTANCCAASI